MHNVLRNFKGKNEKIFGQLQSRVVVADGEAISDNLGNKYNTRGVYDCVGLLVIYCLLLIYWMFAEFHKYEMYALDLISTISCIIQ